MESDRENNKHECAADTRLSFVSSLESTSYTPADDESFIFFASRRNAVYEKVDGGPFNLTASGWYRERHIVQTEEKAALNTLPHSASRVTFYIARQQKRGANDFQQQWQHDGAGSAAVLGNSYPVFTCVTKADGSVDCVVAQPPSRCRTLFCGALLQLQEAVHHYLVPSQVCKPQNKGLEGNGTVLAANCNCFKGGVHRFVLQWSTLLIFFFFFSLLRVCFYFVAEQ